jgi:hypothetical protein
MRRRRFPFVALGALVPDAIDKPLYRLTSIPSDHTIGHTLLLSLVLIAAGALLARRGEPRILWLGLGSLSHPLVDGDRLPADAVLAATGRGSCLAGIRVVSEP